MGLMRAIFRHEERVQQRRALATGCMVLIILVAIIIIAIAVLVTHGAAISHFISHLHKAKPSPPATTSMRYLTTARS
jgi:predicted tellurium resistance membrane protein TerC